MDWPAAPEDAIAYWFARKSEHPVKTVGIVHWRDDETVEATISFAEHSYEFDTWSLTQDIEWISTDCFAGYIIGVSSVFESLALSKSELGECDRSDCSEDADQFVLWPAVYWRRANEEPIEAIQQYCQQHVPYSVPFHAGGTTDGVRHPGFGWSP